MTDLPQHFCDTIVGLYGARGQQWLTDVPRHIAILADQWDLRLDAPFRLSYNYVCPATVRSTGEQVVLKTAPHNPDLTTEIAALRCYAGSGAVALRAVDETRAAFLIQQALPGTRLVDTRLDDTAQTAIAARLFHHSMVPLPVPHAFPTMLQQCAVLRDLPTRAPAATAEIGALHVAAATAIVDRLGRQPATHMLHGDLHHENIVRHGDSWCIIDPKGVCGVPAQECAAYLRNPGVLLESGIDIVALTNRRITQFAENLHIPYVEIAAWNYALMVLSAWWCVEDGGAIPPLALRCVTAFRQVAAQSGVVEAQ